MALRGSLVRQILLALLFSLLLDGVQATVSDDLRWRVVWMRFEDMISVDRISLILRISAATCYRVLRQFLAEGTVTDTSSARKLRQLKINGDNLKYLKQLVDDEPRLYLDEMQAELQHYSGQVFSLKAILNALKRLNYTLKVMKKKHHRRCAEQEAEYWGVVQDIPVSYLLFVDEMHVTRRDVRRFRGWGLRGQRVYDNHGITVGDKRYNVTAALSLDGFVAWDIAYVRSTGAQNPLAGDQLGANTGLKFCRFVTEVLVERVMGEYGEPRCIMVADNASVHEVEGLEQYLLEAGRMTINTP